MAISYGSTHMILLMVVVPMGSLFGQICSPLVAFHRWSTFLASPTFWGLHCTFGSTLIGSHTVLSKPGLLGLPLRSGWKPSWSNSSILQSPKISTMWMTLSSPTSCSSSQASFFLAYRVKCLALWEFWTQPWGINSLDHCHSRTRCFGISSQSMFFQLFNLEAAKAGVFLLSVDLRPSFPLFFLFSANKFSFAFYMQTTALLQLLLWPNSQHFK